MKVIILKPAAKFVPADNQQLDEDGLQYAANGMDVTGLAPITTALWEVSQPTPELQSIVAKHKHAFSYACYDEM